MYEGHPKFEAPDKESTKIWRYLDFPKFASMLDRNELFFAKASQFEDPFEGLYSSILRQSLLLLQLFGEHSDDSPRIRKFIDSIKEERDRTFINCWHMSEYESAAMWELYTKEGAGISIQSNFERLKVCFSQFKLPVYIGMVKYIDWNEDQTPLSNVYQLYLSKRKSFEHEHEIRAIVGGVLNIKNKVFYITEDDNIQKYENSNEDGIYVNVSLDTLIEKIYVSPKSPKWFLDLVKSVSKKYGLDKEVIRSDLYDDLIY